MPKSSVSLIIPVFNGFPHLPLLWESLYPQLGGDKEAIIIDDGSTKDPATLLPGIPSHDSLRVIRNHTSRGFSAAVNTGLKAATGDYLAIMNSDLILQPGTISSLIEVLQADSSIGMASSKLLYPQTNAVQHAGISYSETNHFHMFRHSPADHPMVCKSREVQALAFALCCMPRDIYREIGGLDENYFNSYEDLDYCFRIRRLRKRLVVEPKSIAYHWERQSGTGRNILRKDNVARLWRNWGHEICPDLSGYLLEACAHFNEQRMSSAATEYTLVNLSRGREAEHLVSTLIGTTAGFTVDSVWDLGLRSNDTYYLWLPQILPVEAIRHPLPFIYLVDEIPQLDQNCYWFAFRRGFVTDEILIDHNANVLGSLERFT